MHPAPIVRRAPVRLSISPFRCLTLIPFVPRTPHTAHSSPSDISL